MKRRLYVLLLAALMLCLLVLPATAVGDELTLITDELGELVDDALSPAIDGTYILDYAGLLTDSQRQELEQTAAAISEQYGCGVYVHTEPSIGGQDIRSYTESYYNQNNLGLGSYRNGIVLTLAMDSRDYDLSGYGHNPDDYYDFGNGLTAFTDYGRQEIIDKILPDLSDGDYYEAFSTYLSTARTYLELDAQETPYDVGSREPSKLVPLLITILVPLIIALLVCMVFLGQMKTAKAATQADSYIPSDGFQLTNQLDQYTHTTRTTRHIERDNSNHGGGTSISSGGFSHTSGKF